MRPTRVCILLSLASLPMLGQERATEPEPELLARFLSTPVISASKRVQQILESPQAVEVITREQIDQMGAHRLQDVLRLATSVNLLELEPISAYAGMRGNLAEGYPKNIQVLIDGVPFTNRVRGAVDLDNLPIPLMLVESIEIVRGPSTAHYGSGAVGGVIALKTRRPEETTFGFHGTLGEVRRHYAADAGMAVGRFTFNLGFDGTTSGETGNPVGPLGPVSPVFRPDALQSDNLTHDGAHQRKAMFFAGYTRDDTTLSLTVASAHKTTGANFTTATIIPHELAGNDFAKLGWNQAWTPTLRTEVALNAVHLTSVQGSFTGPESYLIDFRSGQASVQVNYDPVPGLYLVAGWDGQNSRSESILVSRGSTFKDHAWGAFLVADWTFLADWTLSLGGRYERDSMGGGHASPRAVLSWSFTADGSLRAGYYTATRSPQLLEARIVSTRPSVILPNPDLKVERTDSLEAGYRQAWGPWTVDVTAFSMAYEDLIARMTVLPTPPPSGTRQYVNVPGTARDRGVELMVQREFDWLDLGANGTFVTFKDRLDQSYVYTPRTTASVFARFTRGAWSGAAGLQYVGPHRIGNYLGSPTFMDLDGRLRGHFNLNWKVGRGFTVSIHGHNLGGTYDPQGAGGPLQSPLLRGTGRELAVGLDWRW